MYIRIKGARRTGTRSAARERSFDKWVRSARDRMNGAAKCTDQKMGNADLLNLGL